VEGCPPVAFDEPRHLADEADADLGLDRGGEAGESGTGIRQRAEAEAAGAPINVLVGEGEAGPGAE
jgi:hypothetical protein